jgi:DNA primase
MNLFEVCQRVGLIPVRKASTNGGEYASACPKCGGKDRFLIWPKEGRYWCRQCNIRGDIIQFLRDIQGLSYREACKQAGIPPKEQFNSQYVANRSALLPLKTPSDLWQQNALKIVEQAQAALYESCYAQTFLIERGFATTSIERFKLGWLMDTYLHLSSNWGLPPVIQNNKEKKIWLPRGLLIPTFADGKVYKLKIRRTDWSSEDFLPKYVEVTGSSNAPAFYGSMEHPIALLLESELDGMLVAQETESLCCCIALGGASHRPDEKTDTLLKSKKCLLFSFDFDEAGKKQYRYWKSRYPQVCAWPSLKGKSPGDDLKLGVNLRQWVTDGIQRYAVQKNRL